MDMRCGSTTADYQTRSLAVGNALDVKQLLGADIPQGASHNGCIEYEEVYVYPHGFDVLCELSD